MSVSGIFFPIQETKVWLEVCSGDIFVGYTHWGLGNL